MPDPLNVTSPQHHPGEQGPAEDHAHRGEDLAALLGRLLEEARPAGKTQKDLATEAGIPYATLNAWVNRTRGTSRIEPDKLRALVGVFRRWGLEVTPKEMFSAIGKAVPGRAGDEREARLLRIYRELPEERQRDLVKDAEAMLRISRVS
ncbi:helix-turn-helix domain-containing protein [Streptomyces sp. NPDC058335]|uniref:helix-turn-helix domain-containing protein n=1 Tax=Streptomyces sp. NPDC058335 TaxID=3346451 RepID=UPI003653D862